MYTCVELGKNWCTHCVPAPALHTPAPSSPLTSYSLLYTGCTPLMQPSYLADSPSTTCAGGGQQRRQQEEHM